MKAVANRKIIYDGRIRRANAPFEIRDEDVELLVGWGCQIVDGPKPADVSDKDISADIKAELPVEPQVETTVEPQKSVEPPKEAKRKSKKKG